MEPTADKVGQLTRNIISLYETIIIWFNIWLPDISGLAN